MPDNVRMYVAGASHVTVASAPDCRLPPNRLDWAPVARATLLQLDRWVATNASPPPTTLMPLQPATGDEDVLQARRVLADAVVQTPQRDADDNPVGGVRMPDIAVPLGTNGLQNEPHSFTCSLVGTFRPFDHAVLAAHYASNADYLSRVRAAVSAGFLLPMDAAVIVNAAASNPIFERAPSGPPR